MDTMSQPLATTLAVMTPAEVAALLRQFNGWRRDFEDKFEQPDPHEVSEAIDAAVEMIERLEAAESECLEQARLSGMGSEREAALLAKLEAAEKTKRDWLRANAPGGWIDDLRVEHDALRAKIGRMEKRLRLILEEPENTMSNSKAMREMIRQARLALEESK